MPNQPHQPISEHELREIERRWEVASSDPETWGTSASTSLADAPRLIAEIRRLRSLFRADDVENLRYSVEDLVGLASSHRTAGRRARAPSLAQALDDLADRIRRARGEPSA
jgi:hypothetical protein